MLSIQQLFHEKTDTVYCLLSRLQFISVNIMHFKETLFKYYIKYNDEIEIVSSFKTELRGMFH